MGEEVPPYGDCSSFLTVQLILTENPTMLRPNNACSLKTEHALNEMLGDYFLMLNIFLSSTSAAVLFPNLQPDYVI